MIQILKDSFQFFKSNFFKFLTLYVPFFLIQLAIGLLLGLFPSSDIIFLLEFILNISVGSIYYSAIVFLCHDLLLGKKINTKEYFIKGLAVMPLVLFTDSMALLITGVGLLLLIIPGIILGVRLSLSIYNLLLSQDKPIEAIKNSYSMTKGYTKTILGAIALIGIPYFILIVALRVIVNFKDNFIISEFEIGLMSTLFSTFLTIVLFRIYCLINQQRSIA